MRARLYSYDAETLTATCRTCWISEGDLLPEQAGPWHAGHQGQCAGSPAGRPSATVLQFRPAAATQDTTLREGASWSTPADVPSQDHVEDVLEGDDE